jgi:hypothetical protein
MIVRLSETLVSTVTPIGLFGDEEKLSKRTRRAVSKHSRPENAVDYLNRVYDHAEVSRVLLGTTAKGLGQATDAEW